MSLLETCFARRAGDMLRKSKTAGDVMLTGLLHQCRWFMGVVLQVLLQKGIFPGWGWRETREGAQVRPLLLLRCMKPPRGISQCSVVVFNDR